MKFLFKISALFIAIFAFAQTGFCATGAATEAWTIPNFESDITIESDGTLNITENIIADFTNEEHRGIARYIPFDYALEDGSNYVVDLNFISAVDENGNSWDITKYDENGNLVIEMRNQTGTPDNETHTFIINYTAKNVIQTFDEQRAKEKNTFTHDELYWNVNGAKWVVPTENIKTTIHLPKSIHKDQLKMDCLTGIYGATDKNCAWQVVDNETVEFKSTVPLAAYEGLTFILGMPLGTVPPQKQAGPPSTLNIIWPIFIFPIILVGMIILWYKRGRDDKTFKDAIMPHYTPPQDLLPTETGTIIDEKMDPRDLTATILDHAIKGEIKINETQTEGILGFGKTIEYELELLKPYEIKSEYENLILKEIFAANSAGEKKKLSDLKNKFYKTIPEVEKSIMQNLVKKGYFPTSPAKIRRIYTGIGTAIIFISVFFGNTIIATANPITGILFIISLVLSGIAITFIGRKMPKKTAKGNETYYQLKGLYEYINTAEKDRMKFQEDNNLLFEKLLPYAMAFGLIKKWSNAFEGILKTPPAWFVPYHPWGYNAFAMSDFGSKLDKINSNMVSNLTARPGGKGGGWSGGSGFGGGFSGGGFGGGGGRGL